MSADEISREVEVIVTERPGITYFAKCHGSSASCTSSMIIAAKRAAAKHTRDLVRKGWPVRAVAEDEIAVRRIGSTRVWVATFPPDFARAESEVAA